MKGQKVNAKEIYHFIFVLITMAAIVVMAAVSPLLKEGLPKPDYYNQDFEEAKILKIKAEDIQEDAVMVIPRCRFPVFVQLSHW